MKKIEIVLEGTGEGLLMNSAQNMAEQKPEKNPAKKYIQEEEAEKVAYRNSKKELIVPSRCLKACILNASAWIKIGRKSLKPIIAGCTRIEPHELVLTDKKGKAFKKYEIDVRPVVIQGKDRILRARPILKDWRVKFNIIYDETIIGNTPKDLEQLSNILKDAGKRVGLLDNRPQKSYGENGTFRIVKFLPK